MTTVAVFGVSGRTGQALTTMARARSWAVRGFSRISSIVPPGSAVIHGPFHDAGRVAEVVRGADAVCCVFGPRAPFVDVFCAEATRAVVAAMQETGCRRLLCVTGALIGPALNRSRPMEWMKAWFRWRRPAVARDREEQETIVMASNLDWAIVKPPRLTDAAAVAPVVAGLDLPVSLWSCISRADLATFMLDEIAQPRFVRQRVIVQWGT